MANPIHLVPFSGQDYRTSSVRMRSIMTGDRDLRLVYLEILHALPEYGGSLPAESDQLGDILGLPVEVIEKALPVLEDFGRKTRRGGIRIDGGRITNRRMSELLAEKLAFRDQQAEFGRRSGASRRHQNGHHGEQGSFEGTFKLPSSEPEETPNPPSPIPFPSPKESVVPNGTPLSTDRDFAPLWQACAKKVGKGSAESAFGKAVKRGMPPVAEVIAKLQALQATEQWSRDGRRFQPHLATWLNRDGWLDEPGSGSRRAMGATPDRLAAYATAGSAVQLPGDES